MDVSQTLPIIICPAMFLNGQRKAVILFGSVIYDTEP